MMEKQAIVTGAFGFLGRHVAKVFSEHGFHVTGLGHGAWSRNEWQVWGLSEWHICDITTGNLSTYVEQPDVFIHCAGSGSVGYSMTHPMQDFEKTVTTSLSVLEFLRLHSPKTAFIYPSSAAVYGIVDTLPILESAPLNPISPYGVHKKIVEEICQLYATHFMIPIAIARFFSIYGPLLRKQLLWDASRKITKNDLAFYGTGKEIRDWVHVTDAAQLLLILSSRASIHCPIVNGGSGVGTSVSEIINRIMKIMEKPGNPHFSQTPKPGDPPGYVADTRESFRSGWKPGIPFEKGIEEYIHWFQLGAS